MNDEAYSEITRRLIETRENMGIIRDADARGFFLGSCGDRMQIDLRVMGGRIIEATFLTDGCGATIACGSMVTHLARSRSLPQAAKIAPEDVIEALGGLPASHEHCAVLAVMTLREAILDATDKPRPRAGE